MRKSLVSIALLSCTLSFAEPIPISIPNFSFESPTVSRDFNNPFGALPLIGDWDESDVGPGDELNQNTGVFLNTDVGEPDHIDNADQKQLAFLSSLIGNAIRQELPDTFQPDHIYTFTVGVAKSNNFHGFPVGDTEQLEVALFYFRGSTEQIVASTFVTGAQVSSTSLIDVTVTTPVVAADDAWAGKKIGVLVRPDINDPDDTDGEGFWDVDDARLEDLPPLLTLADAATFAHCMTGPGDDPLPQDCSAGDVGLLDLNADTFIDLRDFADFQNLFETH
ncbi:MAG: hypothetical protein HY287_01925 [Planctomycetes bacterium]|nr:hypothetical protein [Planctomycetota bacterium]MBI3833068.1 hypothetical protein [Planctomycetota bacterium]